MSIPSVPYVSAQQASNFTAYYIDVGQGDSELVQFHGHNILIDGGEANEGSKVVSFLRSHNVKSLDLVVNTHPDADHLGGLETVIDDIPVTEIMNDGLTDTTKTYKNFVADVQAKGIPDEAEYAGQTINLDPAVEIQVFSPPSDHLGTDTNTNSIVLKFTYGNESFLFVGDASTKTENYLGSANDNLRADVLKVGHHGSDTSSGTGFLQLVKPEIAVIEVGLNNEYDLPSQNTLIRLSSVGATVYRTDLDGDIEVTTDGNSLSVYTYDNVPVAQIGTASPTKTITPSTTAIPSASPTPYTTSIIAQNSPLPTPTVGSTISVVILFTVACGMLVLNKRNRKKK